MLFNFVLAFFAAPFSKCNSAELKGFTDLRDVGIDGTVSDPTYCTDLEIQQWSRDFRLCFMDKQEDVSETDLENIVDRVMELSSICLEETFLECRVNYRSFLQVMDKVVEQMKKFPEQYILDKRAAKRKIKDLNCIKRSLSSETYAACFKSVFEENSTDDNLQKRNVENALSCTDDSNKRCSEEAKNSLNRMVKIILRAKQPIKAIIEGDAQWPQPKVPTTLSEDSPTSTSPSISSSRTTSAQSQTKESTSPPTTSSTASSQYSSSTESEAETEAPDAPKPPELQLRMKANGTLYSLQPQPPSPDIKTRAVPLSSQSPSPDIKTEAVPLPSQPSISPEINTGQMPLSSQPPFPDIKTEAVPLPSQPSTSPEINTGQMPLSSQSPSPDIKIAAMPSSPPPRSPSSPSPPPNQHRDHHHDAPLTPPLQPPRTYHHHEHFVVIEQPRRPPPPEPTSAPRQPWRWYDYIIRPIASAWNWFRGLF